MRLFWHGLCTQCARINVLRLVGAAADSFPGRREASGETREAFSTVSKSFLKYLAEQTGETTSPHDWRRTFTTVALGAGVPLQVIEWLTAHRSNSIVTLSHYFAPSIEDLCAEVAKIDTAFARLN